MSSLVKDGRIKIEPSPYKPLHLPVDYRQRDFDMIKRNFHWVLHEHCPDGEERNAIALLLEEVTERAKKLTELSTEEGKGTLLCR